MDPAAGESPVSILVVDDQEENLLALEALLRDTGQNLVLARSGREALRALLERDFALVLLDVRMPEMDGFETAAFIRGRERSRHTPIIFLTAEHRSDTQEVRGYAVGAADYLLKPIVPEILRSKVAVFVDLARKTAQVGRQAELLAQRNAELARQNRLAQEATRLKSEFLANMSHELRTPLNAIIGFSELMHDGKLGPVSDAQREYLGDILTSARHLLQLINDVLDLAKVEAGRMALRPERVDLPKIVREVGTVLRALAAGKRIRLETDVDPGLTGIVADPARLKQILYNYLSNALKFTPEEGRVTVRAREEDAGAFRLEVEDTGIGIRPEDLGRLWTEFRQLDGGTAKQYPGTGLGLALTKRLVELAGGRVGVRSAPGRGSLFFAVLPRVVRVEPEPAPESPGPAPAPAGAPRILVVEDNAQDRDWLARVLAGAGYRVETATTGLDAIRRGQREAFDALTLDILLPDVSGWDVLGAIRAEGPNRDAPVVVVTVAADQGVADGFRIHDLLTKPVPTDRLLASLRRARVMPDPSHPVLVVDDDPAVRTLAERTLPESGYPAICRADGESGLRAVAEARPAAVLLDLLMPGMDGFEFLRRLRQIPAGRRVPAIVWTGVTHLTPELRARLHGGAQAVIAKGYGSATALLDELRALLPFAASAPAATAAGAEWPLETPAGSGPAPVAGTGAPDGR